MSELFTVVSSTLALSLVFWLNSQIFNISLVFILGKIIYFIALAIFINVILIGLDQWIKRDKERYYQLKFRVFSCYNIIIL